MGGKSQPPSSIPGGRAANHLHGLFSDVSEEDRGYCEGIVECNPVIIITQSLNALQSRHEVDYSSLMAKDHSINCDVGPSVVHDWVKCKHIIQHTNNSYPNYA